MLLHPASDYVRIGNTAVTAIVGQVAFTPSDGRFKTNVKEAVPGLDFILGLRPVTYHFEKLQYSQFIGEKQHEDYVQKLKDQDAANKTSTGFIAQEVEELAKSLHYDFDGIYKPQNEHDTYALGYQQFVVPLVKAVQELNEINGTLEAKLEHLNSDNANLLSLKEKQQQLIDNLITAQATKQQLLQEMKSEIEQLKLKNE
jgi:hypothetical protein